MSDPFCRKCRQPLGGRHVPDCIWEDQVVPSECDGVIEEAMATVKARKSAEAIARLREKLESHDGDAYGPVNFDDLRAVLDAHAALEQFIYEMCVEKTCHGSTPSLITEACRLGVVTCVDAVLAKAGRR